MLTNLNSRKVKKLLIAFMILAVVPTVSFASIINFSFTGRLVVGFDNSFCCTVNDNGLPYTPITANLSYDTVLGFGSSDMTITLGGTFFGGEPVTFSGVTMTRQGTTNIITGSMVLEFGIHILDSDIEWDATGFFDALDFGLVPGDVLSGSILYHDTNSNKIQDIATEPTLLNLGSATPYSDTIQPDPLDAQGPAPIAATINTVGVAATAIPGFGSSIQPYIDIGSGNSLTVLSITSVPVPAAVWLYGSGLIGLLSIAKRKKA